MFLTLLPGEEQLLMHIANWQIDKEPAKVTLFYMDLLYQLDFGKGVYYD